MSEQARRAALRRSVRAAIVIPATFAFSLLVIRDLQIATFAVFGCFALLVMANFGGRRRARAVAYVAATLVGAALIALERLGVIPGIRAGPAQTGSRIEPIERNGAIYMGALERQRHLYRKLFEESQ